MRKTRPLTALCRQHGTKLIHLAAAIHRPYPTVKKWGGEVEIPPVAIPLIMRFFGGAIQPHDLRPDIFSKREDARGDEGGAVTIPPSSKT